MVNKHSDHLSSQQYSDIEKHPKQDFQVERLAFFSDAVFAIAITLLIIEFKIPHVTKDSTFDAVWQQLLDLRFNLFALLMSFVLTGTYWMRHHFLFKHIHNYNRELVIASLAGLLPIIFFPFSTAFFAESVENKYVLVLALRIFLLNHILAGLSIYVIYWLALVRHKEMSFEMQKSERIKFTSDTLYTTISFALILFITFFSNDPNFLVGSIVVVVLCRKIIERLLVKRLVKNKSRFSGQK